MMTSIHQWQRGVLTLLAAILFLAAIAPHAMAQTPPAAVTIPGATPSAAGGASSDVCTNFAQRKQEIFGGGAAPASGGSQGILSDIYIFIKDVVGDATSNLFHAFIYDSGYQQALGAVFILVVIFFGIAFTMGLLQLSYGQVLLRLVKLGVVMTLISPGGWGFFNDTVVTFFNDGTDDLVKAVVAIGTGTPTPPGATPFYQFDKMAEFIVNPEIIPMLMGMITSGPYGLAMMGLSMIGIIGFITLLIKSLKVYAISFVARSMLMGLAPIFFSFLLFDRTKQLFMSWINAILGTALSPILMFTFLSFFMVLLETASQDMLSTEFCWTDCKAVQGSTNTVSCFRPKNPATGEILRSDLTWAGAVSCLVKNSPGAGGPAPGAAPCPESPINIINILTFLILVYIANRFAEMIDHIANELSNSFIGLDTGGKIGEAMSQSAGNIGNWLKGGAK